MAKSRKLKQENISAFWSGKESRVTSRLADLAVDVCVGRCGGGGGGAPRYKAQIYKEHFIF